ncbi:MAG: hypothetical protein Q4G64_03950, partial [bacterium]|nr:hypothetical protein [bacterium]
MTAPPTDEPSAPVVQTAPPVETTAGPESTTEPEHTPSPVVTDPATDEPATDPTGEPTLEPDSAGTAEPSEEPTHGPEAPEPSADPTDETTEGDPMEMGLELESEFAPQAEAGFTLSLNATDGRAPFDDSDDAGYDSGPSNGIVRTNDTMYYQAVVAVSTPDLTQVTLDITLPQGTFLAAAPSFCGPGSEIETSGPGTVNPALATAWDAEPENFLTQTLHCVINETFEADRSKVYEFPARVLPVFDHGDTIQASLTGSGIVNKTEVTVSGSDTVTTTISAAEKYDVQVMGHVEHPDRDSYIQHEGRYAGCTLAGPSEPGAPTYNGVCISMNMPVQISVPEGGRGSIPLNPATPVEFTLDLTLDTMFGEGATEHIKSEHPEYTDAQIARYFGARLNSCAGPNPWGAPRSALAGGTSQNSVINSGTTTCTVGGAAALRNPNAYGQAIDITVTGMNSTAFTTPLLTGTGTQIQPRDQFGLPLDGFVYSSGMTIVIPTETLGLMSTWEEGPHYEDARVKVATTARDLRLQGAPGNFVGETSETDVSRRNMPYVNRLSYDAWWSAIPADQGKAGWTTPAAEYTPGYTAWVGPGGPSSLGRGDGVFFQDQTLIATTHVQGSVMPDAGVQATLTCTAIDTQYSTLADAPTAWRATAPYPTPGQQRFAPTDNQGLMGGEPVWISGLFWNTSDGRALTDAMQRYGVWYGIEQGATPGLQTRPEDCTQVTWYDSAAEAQAASGADAGEAGTYPGVTHVLVYAQTRQFSGATYAGSDLRYSISIPVKLNEAGKALTPDGTQFVGTRTGGATKFGTYPETNVAWTAEQIRDAVNTGELEWTAASYSKVTNAGTAGDRATITGAVATLTKEVIVPGVTEPFGPSDVFDYKTQQWQPPKADEIPRLTAGQSFSYRLTPKLTGAVEGVRFPIRIEECLPANINLISATIGGRTITPTSPRQQELECDVANPNPLLRETAVLFIYPGTLDSDGNPTGSYGAGDTIPPLELSVEIRDTAPTATDTQGMEGLRGGLVNLAVIKSPAIGSGLSVREARTRIYVDSPAEYRLSKQPVELFVERNPDGLVTPGLMPRFDVIVTNPGSDPVVGMDIIDVLPTKGDDPNEPLFHSTYQVTQPQIMHGLDAPVDSEQRAQLWMTRTVSPNSNPDHASNVFGTGTTVWCRTTIANPGQWADVVPATAGRDACPTFTRDELTGTPLYSGVTAIRATGGEIPGGDFVQLRYSIVPTGNEPGDAYVNLVDGRLGTGPGYVSPAGGDGAGTTGRGVAPLNLPNSIELPEARATVFVDDRAFLTVEKKASEGSGPDGAAIIGDRLTFTLTAKNVGSLDFREPLGPEDLRRPFFLVDDVTDIVDSGEIVLPEPTDVLTARLVSGDGGRTQIHFSGSLPAGESVDITYQLHVQSLAERGTLTTPQLRNVALAQPAGTLSDGETLVDVPWEDPGVYVCEDPVLCAATVTERAVLSIEKAAEVVRDGEVVEDAEQALRDDEVEYTVSVTNTGTVAYTDAHPAYIVDDLSAVLDDAEFVEDSESATIGDGEEAGQFWRVGDQLHWRGPLPVGETVSITYRLAVANPATGDGEMTNLAFTTPYVDDDGDPETPPTDPTDRVAPPGDEDGEPVCDAPGCATTTTMVERVREVLLEKSATILRDGGVVAGPAHPGDVLRYELTIENTGNIPYGDDSQAYVVDSLAGIPGGGADLGTPTATAGEVWIAEDQIHWLGTVPPGDTVTLTYEVSLGEVGNGVARNIAFEIPYLDDDPETTPTPTPTPGTDPVDVPDSCEVHEAECVSTETPVEPTPVVPTPEPTVDPTVEPTVDPTVEPTV